MKKFTCVIASALVMTCSVSLFPAVAYADSESGTVVLDTSDVSADKDGNVELNKPESVNNFEDADIVFKENRGYLKNDSYTMQIVLPAGKEKYESECTRNEPLLLAEMYTYGAQSDSN